MASEMRPFSSLPVPKGRQREVVFLKAAGHVVVLGSAGSGKTTMAILRSADLAARPGSPRVLLVTFQKALVTYLRTIAAAELENVDVCTYHQFANGYLNARGKNSWRSIVKGAQYDALVTSAAAEVQAKHPESALLTGPLKALNEQLVWLVRRGFSGSQDYLASPTVPLDAAERRVVLEVRRTYVRLRSEAGYLYDYDDIAQEVRDTMRADTESRRYTHVVIDEGQDFSPAMIQSLAAAIRPDGSLTFFGDMAQQIFGRRVSWREAGLVVVGGKPWEFRENYRNTAEIAAFALALSNSSFFKVETDLVAPHAPAAAGPLPTLVKFPNRATEIAFALKQAAQMARTQTVGILLRTRTAEDTYIKALRSSGVPVTKLDRDMDTWDPTPGAWVGTYYSAKGLEFDSVLLPACSKGVIPSTEHVDALGPEDALAEEARLFYVAVTRARSRILMTYAGEPTMLLDDVPAHLYQHVK